MASAPTTVMFRPSRLIVSPRLGICPSSAVIQPPSVSYSSVGKLVLKARILSLDGARCVEGASVGETDDAARMGQELAERLLNEGARQILAEIGLG